MSQNTTPTPHASNHYMATPGYSVTAVEAGGVHVIVRQANWHRS
jgi:hypothetical protein